MQHEQYSTNPRMQQFLVEVVSTTQKMMPELDIIPEIVQAYGKLDRADFLPDTQQQYAYRDQAGALRTATGEFFLASTTRPSLVLMMLHLLQVTPQPGLKVAEIGTGSGEVTAILANLGCEVHTIEYDAGLAERARQRLQRFDSSAIHIYTGDGAGGIPQAAPFDRILVTAGASSLLYHLRDQLAPGGLLLHPYGQFRQEDNFVHGHLALIPKSGAVSLSPLHVYFAPLLSPRPGGWTRGLHKKGLIPSTTPMAKVLYTLRRINQGRAHR